MALFSLDHNNYSKKPRIIRLKVNMANKGSVNKVRATPEQRWVDLYSMTDSASHV